MQDTSNKPAIALDVPDKNPTTGIIMYIGVGELGAWQAQNFSYELKTRLANIPIIHYNNGYKFNFRMPVVDFDKVEETYETTSLFGRKIQRTRIKGGTVLLKWETPLTDAELEFWRWFKLGYLTRFYRGNA